MEEKYNILIVDDNESLCKTMRFILKKKGYDITTALDGLEAIEKVKEKSFDIIFLDIKLPLIDGVETYKRIKKIRPNAIVMMMTAYAVDELIQKALKEGANGVLYKPLDLEKIVSLIEGTNDKKQSGFILLVDDDPGFVLTLKNILTRRNYIVGVANTGEMAIKLVQEKTFDIIMIDIKLPSINGLETYLAIQQINPNVVAIMMTGYRQEVDDIVKESIDSSAYTCLYKPLDMAQLLELIERILKLG